MSATTTTTTTPTTDRAAEVSPDASSGAAVAAAKPPVGVGAAPLVAELIALGLVGLGAVGVQDLLARTGAVTQDPWLDTALGAVDGVASDSAWVLVAGVVAAVVGLLLLRVGLRRRPRKAVDLTAETGVRLRAPDLARVVRGSLEAVDGVTEVDVRSTRRTLRVTATTLGARERRDATTRDLREQLAPTLEALQQAPRVKIKVKEASA